MIILTENGRKIYKADRDIKGERQIYKADRERNKDIMMIGKERKIDNTDRE